jgi:dienelactone hydrolase
MDLVRAVYRVAEIPGAEAPYDRVSLKVFYPARFGDTAEERNSGVIPARPEQAPYPVVILLPGINLGPENASWLSLQLAEAGYVTVAVSAITEEMPGYVSVSPGLILDQLKPHSYGHATSCSLLAPVFAELSAMQENSVLAGLLDLDRIVLAGHSAGGTTALLNANPAWFPGVRAVFCYAAHSGASMALGWPAETVLDLPAAIPTLMLSGDCDGVIASSAHRYGSDKSDPLYTVSRTFDEAVPECGGRSYLLVLKGANHFTFAHPGDGATGREFLDWPGGDDQNALRGHIAELVLDFLASTLHGDEAAAQRMEDAQADPSIVLGLCK